MKLGHYRIFADLLEGEPSSRQGFSHLALSIWLESRYIRSHVYQGDNPVQKEVVETSPRHSVHRVSHSWQYLVCQSLPFPE